MQSSCFSSYKINEEKEKKLLTNETEISYFAPLFGINQRLILQQVTFWQNKNLHAEPYNKIYQCMSVA